MNDSKKAPGCLKGGCIGCLAITAAVVVLFLVLGAIQIHNDSRDPVVERVDRSQTLPGEPFQAVTERPETFVEETGEGTTIELSELPRVLPLPEELAAAAVTPGKVTLDLAMGRFLVRPGPANEPLRVEATYDSASFRLEEELVDDGETGWSYRVKFGARGGFLGMIGGKEVDNEVTVVIPRGRPITLVGDVGLGESEIELGGLWLRGVELELGMGDHRVEWSEPTLEPVPSVRIESSAGEIEILGLGHASPAKAVVEQSFGETRVDLRGLWRNDSAVEVSFGFGECRIRQPENAYLAIDRLEVAAGERRSSIIERDLPDGAPTVRLKASGSAGELRVE